MSRLSNDEFAEKVLKIAPAKAFSASAYYDRDGDCIEFLARPDDFYSERIDDLVTVYYSENDNEIVGSLIKGVRELLDSCPNLELAIHAGKVRLSHLFLVGGLSRGFANETTKITYKKLIECADQASIEADICMA